VLLRSLSEQAFRYFRNIDPETFVDFAIPARFDFYTSNLAESFNNLIGNAREENVIGLVEFIHLDWMTKWYERTRNKLQPQALKNLPKLYLHLDARKLRVHMSEAVSNQTCGRCGRNGHNR
jgi:hypothetical protein